MLVGLVAWIYVRKTWPDIGQAVVHPVQ
jgi:hypothetical protein